MSKFVSYTLLLLLLLAAPTHAALIFHQDWEDGRTGSPSEGFYPSPNQYAGPWSLTSSTDRHRAGERSLKFLVNNGDFDPGERIRCTMEAEPNGSIGGKRILPYDQERWFGFSVWIRSESNMTAHGICNFHQHNWGASGCTSDESPPIGFNIWGPKKATNGKYEWVMVSNTDYNGADSRDRIWYEDASDEMDQWVDFVIRVNFSFGDGVLQVWKNGVLVVNKPNFTLRGFPTPQYCGDIYPKISAGAVNPYMPILAYQDSHRWGDENSSYEEVDPAQSASPPPPPEEPTPTGDRIEAETGSLLGTMEIIQDSNASGGSYTRTIGTGEGAAEFTVTAEAAGSYAILARVYAWSDSSDTLFVSVDDGPEQKWDLNVGYQIWADVESQFTLNLSKGTHKIRFRGENDSARLDNFTIENVQLQLISPPADFQIIQ